MRCKPLALSCAVVAIGCIGSASAWASPDARGVWLSDTGRGAIEIKDCGDKLCGHVVWTRDVTDASRGCGKQMIGDVAPSGDGVWDGGWVYSPDKKRRFDVELKPLADGTLRVTGYAGTRFFSKTMIWTKAPADLQRCDASKVEASAEPPAAAAVETPAPAPAPAPAAVPAVPAPIKEAAKAPEPAKPAPVAKQAEPAQVAPKQAATPPQTEPAQQQKPEPRVADADDSGDDMPKDIDGLVDKLDGKEFGDGYGLKKVGNGDCRVKLPYVTITVPCKK